MAKCKVEVSCFIIVVKYSRGIFKLESSRASAFSAILMDPPTQAILKKDTGKGEDDSNGAVDKLMMASGIQVGRKEVVCGMAKMAYHMQVSGTLMQYKVLGCYHSLGADTRASFIHSLRTEMALFALIQERLTLAPFDKIYLMEWETTTGPMEITIMASLLMESAMAREF